METTGSKRKPAQGNMRLLTLLEEIARIGAPVAPHELLDRVDLPKATLHRLMTALQDQGFLQKLPDGRSIPARRTFGMAANILSAMRIPTAVSALLRELSEEIGETCNIAICKDGRMIYTDRAETKWPLQISLPIGSKIPLHCSASGKTWLASMAPGQAERLFSSGPLERYAPNTITSPEALLAEVEHARLRGWSEDNEEFIEGMTALAVPIHDAEGRLFSTLSFHAPVQRMPIAKAREQAEILHRTARDMTALIFSD